MATDQSMSREQWVRIETILDQVLDLESDRDTELAWLCDGDNERYQHRMAIKLIPRGLETPEALTLSLHTVQRD